MHSRSPKWYTKKMKISQILLLGVLLMTSSFASAHGTGVSYEENKDGYKIDVGHDEFIAQGESTRFDFALYPENIETIEGEIFTDVWVTFTKDKKIYFAGGVSKPVFGTTGFTYVFPEEGGYVVTARFQKGGETITKTEFPLTVLPPLNPVPPPKLFVLPSVFLCLGFGIGVIGTVVFRKLIIKK